MAARKKTTGRKRSKAKVTGKKTGARKRTASRSGAAKAAGGEVAPRTGLRLIVRSKSPMTAAAVAKLVKSSASTPVSAAAMYPDQSGPKVDFLVRLTGSGGDVSTAEAFDLAHSVRDESGGKFAWVEPDVEQKPSVGFPDDNALRAEAGGDIFSGFCEENAVPPGDHFWHLREMRVQQAWDHARDNGAASRGQGIRVGHLDTGWTDHADLKPSLDLRGQHDFVDDDDDAKDPFAKGNPFHGTKTGTVIASTFPGDLPPATDPFGGDLSGVAPLAKIVPIRVVTRVVVFKNGDVARGIRHAADNDCQVVSMSLGGVMGNALHDSVKYAVAKNVIVCAAAGNCVRTVVWPARYAETIAVGGTNSRNQPWKGSCRGDAVDVSAPAAQVWTAAKPSAGEPRPSAQGEGTSYAVAAVAGIAALWLAHHGRDTLLARYEDSGIRLQFVYLHILKKTARDVGLPANQFGAGLVDALAVLKCPLPDPSVISVEQATVIAARPDVDIGGLLEPAAPLVREMATVGLRSADSAAERDLLAQEFAQICLDHPNAHDAYRRGLVLAGAGMSADGGISELLEGRGIAKYASKRLKARLVT